MKQLSVVGTLCAAMAGLLGSGHAQAILVDRGSGMLYDTVLNITWLQDANHSKTSGYCNTAGTCTDHNGQSLSSGQMNWTQANTWANNLNHGGHNDWRLARNSPVNGTPSGWNDNYSTNGTTDYGYNITSTFSELSYMYYVNLGLKGAVNPDGSYRVDFGVNGTGPFGSGGQNDVGLVNNLQSAIYWYGMAYAPYPDDVVWSFSIYSGGQEPANQSGAYFAWAVRDGDVTVAAIPVPGSVALLAGELALLGVMTRRRKSSASTGILDTARAVARILRCHPLHHLWASRCAATSSLTNLGRTASAYNPEPLSHSPAIGKLQSGSSPTSADTCLGEALTGLANDERQRSSESNAETSDRPCPPI